MSSKKLKYDEYIPVDVEQLRPDSSFTDMINIRQERMSHYWDGNGRVRSDFVERISCPLCEKIDYGILFQKEGFDFVQCLQCDFIFVNPQLKPDAYFDVYKDKSYSDIIKGLVTSSNDYRKKRFGKERMDIVEEYTEGTQNRLLDIGCTTGFLLEAAFDRGWDAYGVEMNQYAAEVARQKGLKVENSPVEDVNYPDRYFDAITIFDVIEHVRTPLPILSKINKLLRPEGMVYIYTPNWNCAERLIMGKECHFIWGSNHLNYFTQTTLQAALEKTGFEVVHYETQGLDVEDIIWWSEQTHQFNTDFLKAFRHQLQFCINAGDWGKTLRMYGRKKEEYD